VTISLAVISSTYILAQNYAPEVTVWAARRPSAASEAETLQIVERRLTPAMTKRLISLGTRTTANERRHFSPPLPGTKESCTLIS
jgi:hypothetical protein